VGCSTSTSTTGSIGVCSVTAANWLWAIPEFVVIKDEE
jgi:hypothetical protein